MSCLRRNASVAPSLLLTALVALASPLDAAAISPDASAGPPSRRLSAINAGKTIAEHPERLALPFLWAPDVVGGIGQGAYWAGQGIGGVVGGAMSNDQATIDQGLLQYGEIAGPFLVMSGAGEFLGGRAGAPPKSSAGPIDLRAGRRGSIGILPGDTVGPFPKPQPRKTSTPKVDQYALVAVEEGNYPVMKRGFAEPQGTAPLNAGDVWKYGKTKNPDTRYSDVWLKRMGLRYRRQFAGDDLQALAAEKAKIMAYEQQCGRLPPGNKIRR